jgi:hypothetical protein
MAAKGLVGAFSKRHARAWLVVFVLLLLTIPARARGLTTISQGYLTDDKLTAGSIVSLDEGSSDHVSAATNSNVDTILGVVISDGNSLLELSNGQTKEIQVATSGIIQVLVSDINGDITNGDQITASPISGIGMKATDSVKVVGIAQGKLDKKKGTVHNYTDKSGQQKSVVLGEIPVLVNVSYYFKQPSKTLIPSVIQSLANALAGKAVKPLPIIISLGIFVIALVAVVSIVYSMIHSSIISVGRNPMSQSAIYRNLVQISGLVVSILAVTLVSIYMILTRL